MPSASRTIPLEALADLLSVWTDGEPEGAEVVDLLPGRIAGIMVGDHVVKRVAAVRDLCGSIRAFCGRKQRRTGAGPSLWCAIGQQGRPILRAALVAGRCAARVRREEIERPAGYIDADGAPLGVGSNDDGHGYARRRG